MKRMYVALCVCVCSIIALTSFAADSAKVETASADVGPTNVVVEFYKALLQEAPPTMEQEKALFESSGLRANLVAVQGYVAADPVILQLFRKHKDLFLPLNTKKPLLEVQISSPFKFVRNLERMKDNSSMCYVMALFPHDWQAVPARLRTIVFEISDRGKIDPDGIDLDGFQGQSAFEIFFKMPVPPPNSSR